MRRILSIFFAFSLLLASTVGEASVQTPDCASETTCCCDTQMPCCPAPAAPQGNCGRNQVPLQAAKLPQAPNEVASAPAAGDPYAHPWPAELEQPEAVCAEVGSSHSPAAVEGALARGPDRLSKLRMLRI